MQQLWLLSPALGSCISNLGRFLASNNIVRIKNLEQYFYGPINQPLWTSAIQNLVSEVRSSVVIEISFSQVRPYLDLLLNLRHFGHFALASTSFLQHLLGSKIVARMMKI